MNKPIERERKAKPRAGISLLLCSFFQLGQSPELLLRVISEPPGNCNSLSYTLAPKMSVSCLTMWRYEDHTTHMLIPKGSRIRSLRLYSWSKGIMPSFISFQIRKIKVEVWGKHSSILAGSFLLSFLWPPSQSILTDNWTRNSAPGNHQPAFPPIN